MNTNRKELQYVSKASPAQTKKKKEENGAKCNCVRVNLGETCPFKSVCLPVSQALVEHDFNHPTHGTWSVPP